MIRFFYFAFVLSQSLAWTAQADGCDGKITYCFDGCSAQTILVQNADSCNAVFDPQRACVAGSGYCSIADDDHPSGNHPGDGGDDGNHCRGQSTYCFDGCSSQNILVQDADSCSANFDPQRSCVLGTGYCSKR